MFSIRYSDRHSFTMTAAFWDLLNSYKQVTSDNSIEYAVLVRDELVFQLAYSYGLRAHEIQNLLVSDFNLDSELKGRDAYGSIFVRYDSKIGGIHKQRLVYSVFPDVIDVIQKYLCLHKSFFPNQNYLFSTSKGNLLSVHYLCKRLNRYNNALTKDKKINTFQTFRHLYLADLLRIDKVSLVFVNNQFGNNIIDNQLYSHLLPNKLLE